MEINELQKLFHKDGKIEWIGIRPERKAELAEVEKIEVSPQTGLEGDHYQGRSGKRQVTLIQAEHLQAVAALLNKDTIDPKLTRRNIVVSGINLIALKEKRIRIGADVILEVTGICAPCSRMERNLGKGGYNAMRGHGGICAKVIHGGTIRLGDSLQPLTEEPSASSSIH